MIRLDVTSSAATAEVQLSQPNDGAPLIPVQAKVTGTATWRLMGRVHPDAGWLEIRAPAATPALEAISWVPYLQLEQTAGSGSVALFIGV